MINKIDMPVVKDIRSNEELAKAYAVEEYFTPCGLFMVGERVKSAIGELFFQAYVPALEFPYICTNHSDGSNILQLSSISKIPEKEYEPYDRPDIDWIGKYVHDLESVDAEDVDLEIIAICKNGYGEFIITVEPLGSYTLQQAFKCLEWSKNNDNNGQNKPFGKLAK